MMNQRNRRAHFRPATVFVLLGGLMLPGAVLAQTNTNTVAAQQEVRIQELESQISALTGQVEQLSYQVRQLTDKLDRMTSDFDFRLTQLEGGGGQGDGGAPAAGADGASTSPDYSAAAPAPAPAAAPAAPPQPAAATATGSDGVAASTPGTGPQVLGTLSQTEYDAQMAGQQNSAAAAQQAMDATNAQTGSGQVAAVAPAELQGATPDEQYQYAFGLLRENRYDDAEKALRTFITANPEHQLTGNANYWLGETYYVRGDYKNAAITFAQGVKNYPQSGKAPDNMLKLGMALAAMGQTPDACTAFSEVGKRYPQASDSLKDRVVKEKQRNSCK